VPRNSGLANRWRVTHFAACQPAADPKWTAAQALFAPANALRLFEAPIQWLAALVRTWLCLDRLGAAKRRLEITLKWCFADVLNRSRLAYKYAVLIAPFARKLLF